MFASCLRDRAENHHPWVFALPLRPASGGPRAKSGARRGRCALSTAANGRHRGARTDFGRASRNRAADRSVGTGDATKRQITTDRTRTNYGQ